MPHKLHGGILGSENSLSDLPPSKTPTPSLSTSAKPKKRSGGQESSKHDTPRAFSRLFQPYRPPRASEDDGVRHAKRRKTVSDSHISVSQNVHASKSHTQSDTRSNGVFAASNKPRPSSKPKLSLKDISKASKSRLEKKMQRMQQEWRLEDERLKAKRQRMGEDREGFVDEENVEEMGVVVPSQKDRPQKKRKKGKEVDLWEADESEKRGPPLGQKGLVGLHDVVQAPPRLKKPGGAQSGHFQKAVGGLKRQAELSEGRKQVIEGYRAMMKQKRESIGKP